MLVPIGKIDFNYLPLTFFTKYREWEQASSAVVLKYPSTTKTTNEKAKWTVFIL